MNKNDHTTFICLFHDKNHAEAALQDLRTVGIPQSDIRIVDSPENMKVNATSFEQWKVPERDANLLMDGINQGGVVIAVSATEARAAQVEAVFERHQAGQVDEAIVPTPTQTAVASQVPTRAGQEAGVLDVVEETLQVGKREVQRGGVRVYQRVIEKPVTETVKLREEHVRVERRPADRPATTTDFQEQAIAVTETGEEAVVAKQARVVEEVVIGKEVTERTEQIKDTVRRTDVTVEELEAVPPSKTVNSSTQRPQKQ